MGPVVSTRSLRTESLGRREKEGRYLLPVVVVGRVVGIVVVVIVDYGVLLHAGLAETRKPRDVEAVVGAQALQLQAVLGQVVRDGVIVDIARPAKLQDGSADRRAVLGDVLGVKLKVGLDGGEEDGREESGRMHYV